MSVYGKVKTGLAFPTLLDIILRVVVLVVGVPIVYLLSKALKLRPKPVTIADPRKEAIMAFLVIITLFVARLTLDISGYTFIIPSFPLYSLASYSFGAIDVLWYSFVSAVYLIPLIIAMERTGQTLKSIGINGKDRGRMLALGFILSAIYLTITGFLAPSLGGASQVFLLH